MSRRARNVIADDDTSVLVSAASAWEISTKVRLGKLLEWGQEHLAELDVAETINKDVKDGMERQQRGRAPAGDWLRRYKEKSPKEQP